MYVPMLTQPPALPHPATSRAELVQHQYDENKLGGKPLRVVAASGPYTDAADLAFRPWHAFMSLVEAEQPDVLVLMGPFLSASHEKVATGDLDAMPTDIFRQHIGQRLTRLLERAPGTMAILVPSTEDVFHTHHAYPQPFLDKTNAALGLPKRVRCLPNPSVFYINELAIGVSTADVLGDLRREELVQRVQADDKAPSSADARDPMMRLARHVLGQRSFYPIFPPSSASMLPLDLSHSRLCGLDQVTPDLLLLPSARVKPFLRVVDSTMVVNPGALASPAPAGTPKAAGNLPSFVRMQVDAMPRDTLFQGEEASHELITHELYSRARIDLVHTS